MGDMNVVHILQRKCWGPLASVDASVDIVLSHPDRNALFFGVAHAKSSSSYLHRRGRTVWPGLQLRFRHRSALPAALGIHALP